MLCYKNVDSDILNNVILQLHTPLSASVVLQWTIRDGHKVNLPWALLVKDDLIYLKPGYYFC